jgi:hypothetical protein
MLPTLLPTRPIAADGPRSNDRQAILKATLLDHFLASGWASQMVQGIIHCWLAPPLQV